VEGEREGGGGPSSAPIIQTWTLSWRGIARNFAASAEPWLVCGLGSVGCGCGCGQRSGVGVVSG
jgi:hypothetical protein